MISTSVLEIVDVNESSQKLELNSITNERMIDEGHYSDYNSSSFQEWAQNIANRSRTKVESIIGMCDNAQYIPELEKIIVRTFKLFPCWSSIMRQTFGYGEKVASSSRIECNFNHIKHRVFKNDHLPVRVDTFVERLTSYYSGDHLLIQGESNDGLCVVNSRSINDDDKNSSSNNDSMNEYDENNENNDIDMNYENGNHQENSNDSVYNDSNNDDDDIIIGQGLLLEDNMIGTSLNRNDETVFKQFIRDTSSPVEIVNISSESTQLQNKPPTNYQKSIKKSSSSCLMCQNGHFPTGVHKCQECRKPVHLFGCSIDIPGTEEGFGEYKICLECNEKKLKLAESNAIEKWCRKRKSQNSQTIRSSKSYLVQQPGFELIDSNKKGNITSVILLKNGNCLLTRPILLPSFGKFLITNTCSVDSILSLLATTAADSPIFRDCLVGMVTSNLTCNIALGMIKEKNKKNIYLNRIRLILQHFESRVKSIEGGLKTIDVIGTAASILDKMMDSLPSLIRNSRCENNCCSVPVIEIKSSKMSLNLYENEFQIQKEIDESLKIYKETCVYCGNERNVTTTITTHIFIEISSLPECKLL